MKNIYILIAITLLVSSCFKGKKVDLIIHNAKIHSMNSENAIYQAMAVKDGKIIELGAERQILNKYRSDEELDALEKDVFPGFSDAHTHLLRLAQVRLSANLSDAQTVEQISVLLEKYHSRNNRKFILGHGLQLSEKLSSKEISEVISRKFPTTPVYLIAKNFQLAVLNKAAEKQISLDLTNSDGLVAGNAFALALKKIPSYPPSELSKELFDIQDELFQFGIVAVHEMDWSKEDYLFFRSLTKNSKWKLHISAYLLPSEENKKLLQNGKIITDKIQLRGITVALNEAVNFSAELDATILFAYNHELQLVAQTANEKSTLAFLERIKALQLNIDNLKWRLEHLESSTPQILQLLTELHIIPSVQPSIAINDAWKRNREFSLSPNQWYAYKSLLSTNEIIAIGSGLPLETFNPFEIIWAANARKDIENTAGFIFNPNEKLDVSTVLKAYTLYNASLVDNEMDYGTIEVNKPATFFISELPINASYNSIYNYAKWTFIKSRKVYSVE